MSAIPRHFIVLVALTCTTVAPSLLARSPGHQVAIPKTTVPDSDGVIVRIQAPRMRLKGNIANLSCVLSGSKALLASASHAEGLVVWDITTGKRVRQFQPQTKERPSSYAVSPDAALLATHLEDAKTLRLDQVNSGKHLADIKLPEPFLAFSAFSPDGKLLAACTANKEGKARIDVWDTATAKSIWHMAGQFGPLAFLPDGNTLLTGGVHRTRFWDLKTGKETERLDGTARLLAVAKGGKSLAVLGDKSVAIWDLAALEKRHEFQVESGRHGEVNLVWSADAKTLAYVGKEGLIAWDAQTGKERSRAPELAGASFIALAPDGDMLYAASSDAGFIFRWDMATGQDADAHLGPSRAALGVGILESGTIVTAETDLQIRFWDIATGKPSVNMPVLKGLKYRHVFDALLVPRIQCAPNGKLFALLHESNKLQLRDGRSAKVQRVFDAASAGAVTFSPDGKTLAVVRSSSGDLAQPGRVDVCDIATGKTVQSFAVFSADAYRMAFSPNSKILYVSSDALRRYDLATGKLLGRLNNTSSSDIYVAGDAIVCKQQTMVIIDAATGRQRHAQAVPFAGPTMAVSGEGLMATADEEGRILLTALPACKVLGDFKAHDDFITCLAFSPDNKQLVTCSDDRSIVVWDIATVLKKLERRAGASADAKEQERLWSEMGSDDPAVGHRAVWALISKPQIAAPMVKDRLAKWQFPLKPGQVAGLIKELESPDFATRQKATVALEKLGDPAIAEMQAALTKAPALETRRRIEQVLNRYPLEGVSIPLGDSLRAVRAVEVLELIATPQAREILGTLKDHWNIWTSRHASEALQRLAWRDQRAQTPAKAKEKAGAGKRVDAAGDPIPEGAVARFGSARLRHGGRIGNVSISPDGRWIGSASLDQAIRVWSAADGKFHWEEQPPARAPANLTFSPDGNLAAVAGYHGEVLIGDLRTGKEAYRLKKEDFRSPDHLAFTPDGRFLATQEYSRFTLWDLKEKQPAKEFAIEVAVPKEREGRGGLDRTYGLSSDGRLVAVCASGESTVVAVFDTFSGKNIAQFPCSINRPRRMVISGDGRRLAMVSDFLSSSVTEVYELATGKLQASLKTYGQYWTLALSPDGRTVAIGGPSSYVQLWDTATGATRSLPNSRGVDALAFSLDGRLLAIGNERGVVRAVEVETGKELFPEAPEGKAMPIAFADKGQKLLIQAGENMHICAVSPPNADIAAWQIKETRQVPIETKAVAASPDGSWFTDAIWFKLSLWDTATATERRQIELHNGFDSVALTSKHVAIMTSGRISLHELATGKKVQSFTTVPEPTSWLISPDEKTLVAVARSNEPPMRVGFFDLATGKRMRLLEVAARPNYYYHPFPMALSPDGATLAIASDKEFLLLDANSGAILHRLPRDGVVAFSPDGKTLATGGYERVVRLYDIATGKKIAERPGHAGDIIGLRWSPDGRLLASGSTDMTVLLWDMTKK